MKESLVEESLDCWNCVNYENRLIEDVPSSSWQIIVGRELDRRLFWEMVSTLWRIMLKKLLNRIRRWVDECKSCRISCCSINSYEIIEFEKKKKEEEEKKRNVAITRDKGLPISERYILIARIQYNKVIGVTSYLLILRR